MTSLDHYLGTFDVRTRHEIEVSAPAEATYQAARELDVGKSVPVAALFAIRAIPHFVRGKARPSRSITLETFLEAGFVFLEENAPKEFVMGVVGKFWRPDSGMVRVAADDFLHFEEPGFAKAIVAFTVKERARGLSLLATETRVACIDRSSRRKFLLYWRAIGPFSGLIRHLILGQVKRTAERT